MQKQTALIAYATKVRRHMTSIPTSCVDLHQDAGDGELSKPPASYPDEMSGWIEWLRQALWASDGPSVSQFAKQLGAAAARHGFGPLSTQATDFAELVQCSGLSTDVHRTAALLIEGCLETFRLSDTELAIG